MRRGWYEIWDGETVTVTRVRPVRWDVVAQTVLEDSSRVRVAHQVRQDLWRAMQAQRGFAPAVAVSRLDGGLVVQAGGRIDGHFDQNHAVAKILGVLESPRNRARWLRFAVRRVQLPLPKGEDKRFLTAAETSR